MNQALLSAIFLQKALAYSPQERIFQPETQIQQTLDVFSKQERNKNGFIKSDKEVNRDFFLQLAKPKKNNQNNNIIDSSYEDTEKTNKDRQTTLIIAPHPDDEILGAANLISEKIKSREKIKIIYVTDGNASENENLNYTENYGQIRRLESIKAAQRLGLKKSDLFFLGFPDGYLDKLPEKGIIQSKFTEQDKASNDSYFPKFGFSKKMLVTALERIIKEVEPNKIYFTSPQDTHPDHSILGEIFISNFQKNPAKKFTYAIHKSCENQICSCDKEIDKEKLKLIYYFQSQRFNKYHKDFLDQFACQKEVFKEINL